MKEWDIEIHENIEVKCITHVSVPAESYKEAVDKVVEKFKCKGDGFTPAYKLFNQYPVEHILDESTASLTSADSCIIDNDEVVWSRYLGFEDYYFNG